MDLQRDGSFHAALQRLAHHRLGIRHVLSIGAGGGSDSLFLQDTLCPDAEMLLIEAQSSHGEALEAAARTRRNVSHMICAASAQDGYVNFSASAPTGGAITAASETTVSVPARSIDSIARERGWQGPFLLKFDTHGVELDILSGASETLRKTALIMMEVYNFKLNFVGGKNLRFFEMCYFLENHGFRCVDFCDPLFRLNDYALWQMHMFFIRDDHPLFKSNSYSAPNPFASQTS